MGGESNRVVLYDDQGSHPLPAAAKDEIASGIVAHLAAMLANKDQEL